MKTKNQFMRARMPVRGWGGIGLAMLFFARLIAGGAPVSTAPKPDGDQAGALVLLETHCVKCHGGGETKGGLDLMTREALLRGGDSGAVLVPGKPEASLLMQMVRHEKEPGMPHKQKKLPEEDIRLLAQWIRDGARYSRPLAKPVAGALASAPAATPASPSEADRAHWAFQPLKRPALPAASAPTKAATLRAVANPIDRFILAKLEAKGLTLSPPASKATLIRRVTFDLVGLPPTPEEIDSFSADAAPDAYEKLVERLLSSPHYGERWARHWLDLVRYAETDGFEHDAVRPHSWRYRDYVIDAFNHDKPYDRFIREQLAGDELWPEEPEALIATGFNLLGPDMVDSSDQVQRRHNTLNDMTDTTALTFLGLTLGCARCHDHKFEPLLQRDYYSFQACFTPAVFRREQPVATIAERAAYERALKQFEQHPKVLALAQLETPVRDKIRQGKLAKLSPEAQAAHQTPPGERNAEQANLVLETEKLVAVSEKELADALTADERQRRKVLVAEVKRLPRPASLPLAMTLASTQGAPGKTFVLHRGEYSQPGEEVQPAFPAILALVNPSLSPSPGPATVASNAKGKRTVKSARTTSTAESPRATLAGWIASSNNPLTARVMVNRIWQHHFGRGLVPTPNDFGTRGQRPTHPELLDWLACEFMTPAEAGFPWSVKHIHRLILTSATYRQATSTPDASPGAANPALVRDPDNTLYWHMNRQRLEGEVIRDSLLAISGQLNSQLAGPSVFPPLPEAIFKGATGWTPSKEPRDRDRRSIYIFARRNLRFPFLEVFDAPDNNLSCPARERSTTAPQALTLLNADEVTTAAQLTARRFSKTVPADPQDIAALFRLALGRGPTAKEQAITSEFLAHSPLSELCRALFNLNDFVYVE